MKLRLFIDDRERAVFNHLEAELKDIFYEVKRLEIGDYALVDIECDKVLAVFERKTLEDYAASLKDGRHQNKISLLTCDQRPDVKSFT